MEDPVGEGEIKVGQEVKRKHDTRRTFTLTLTTEFHRVNKIKYKLLCLFSKAAKIQIGCS